MRPSKKKTKEVETEPRPTHILARCVPREDRVVIRLDIADKTTAGGIILPDSMSNDKQQTGTVWSVGPGKYNKDGDLIPIGLAKGDRVIITGWAGLEVNDPQHRSGSEWVIIREDDVLAVVPA